MGNRGGALHNDQGELTSRRWTSNRWIICLTEFKDVKRQLMTPGLYTELFFHDEATALAAGHRPCWECRREDFKRFKHAWLKGNPEYGFDEDVKIDEIDRVLQHERVNSTGEKGMFKATLGELPDGAMIVLPHKVDSAGLVWEGRVFPWSFNGYGAPVEFKSTEVVQVLTPSSTVKALRAGFVPKVSLVVEGID